MLFLAIAGLVSALLLSAWVGDDAYITFRVIDNFVHGYGLRWNTGERVQAYTHPLWMLLHIPFYYFWRNIYLLTIALSIACAIGAVLLIMRCWPRHPAHAAFFLVAPLVASRAWVSFTVSGLENPLSFLLFAWFGHTLIHDQGNTRWFRLSLLTALAMLNRLDTGILYAPVWLFLLALHRKSIPWKLLTLGASPLLAWFAFSLFYYGFVFPNTKYAKLHTGIAALDYAIQGLRYLVDFSLTDLPAALVLFLGIGVACRYGRAFLGNKDESMGVMASVGAGALLYCGYIVVIGGDFMSGRFFTLPFFASLWLLYGALPKVMRLRIAVATVAALGVLHYASSRVNQHWNHQCQLCFHWGLADERWWYASGNTLVRNDGTLRRQPEFMFAHMGKSLRINKKNEVITASVIGMMGYYAGPDVHIVDTYALSDALIARLPVKDPTSWRIGHFERRLPKGYLHALRTGSTERMDAAMAEYYKPLRRIISGDLWSLERLKTIVLFNLGYYDF